MFFIYVFFVLAEVNGRVIIIKGFFLKYCCYLELLFICKMIVAQGCRLLRDERSGETPNGAKRQEAHRTPRGKRATWSGNQPLSRATMYAKTAE
ncbi:hypothetical protein UN64_00955 [Fictibacillus arsenicus]|uniref:Uncharacterized protein n=1 Tax=Fictibacillus arsenicus TaxID=255247 RepID=A0A1V3GAE4_9BACL|nr:hypothetical protein UN64_00955 [Fictibacillus arsenicus]